MNPHRIFMNHMAHDQVYWNDKSHTMSIGGWRQYLDFWAFPDDLKIEKLNYNLDEAKIESQKQLEIFKETLTNPSTVM